MSYIENIYVCLAAPLLVAVLCTSDNRWRTPLFLLVGMTVCLLSSYISTFFALATAADTAAASVEIAPLVEETMKLLPVLFYLLVFEPGKKKAAEAVLMVAIGFATFENVCFLLQDGAASILHLLIRGFGTGAMHVLCGVFVSVGLLYLWDKLWLQVAGTFGLLATASVFHAVYNILVLQTGPAAVVGYLIPSGLTVAWVAFGKRAMQKYLS